jgi:hypothetical protein
MSAIHYYVPNSCQCTTPDQLLLELEKLEDALAPEETEDTWGKFEKALLRFAAVTRGGGYRHTDVYLQGVGIKGLGDKIVRCVSPCLIRVWRVVIRRRSIDHTDQ